ncbi:MAG: tripartite tricarboxylate transporter substrate binding protein [Rhizobacter sp.]|nr:tripartite tricarboxylate transporter substrate binding protein [Rhizobacter sp.]
MIAGISGAAEQTSANKYPSRTIRFICPFAPGGSVDISTRLVARELTKRLGQAVVVENKDGSSGIIGTEFVAHAEPDGYTMVMGSSSTFGVNPSLYSNLAYDPRRDFSPVAMISVAPNVLVVNSSVPAHSVKELVALAKAHPNTLAFASSGYGGAPHLAGELFKVVTGADILHVPYRGTGQATTDLIAGQVQMSFGTVIALLPFIAQGQVRALAVTSSHRLAALPDVPTMAEVGFPSVSATSWNGVLVPARTPKSIVTRLNREIVEAISAPAFKKELLALGAETESGTPEEFGVYIDREISTWSKVVKAAGLHVN